MTKTCQELFSLEFAYKHQKEIYLCSTRFKVKCGVYSRLKSWLKKNVEGKRCVLSIRLFMFI